MSATKAILSALWAARQARRAPRLDLKAALQREFYRRDLAQLVRAGFVERFEKADDTGKRWVTIGAHDHEGGTPVQIDGQGNIVKGPAALKGKPAEQPEDDNPRGAMPPDSYELVTPDKLTPSQRAHFDQLQAQWSGRPDQTTPPQAGAQ